MLRRRRMEEVYNEEEVDVEEEEDPRGGRGGGRRIATLCTNSATLYTLRRLDRYSTFVKSVPAVPDFPPLIQHSQELRRSIAGFAETMSLSQIPLLQLSSLI
jgi:hypothetical protein